MQVPDNALCPLHLNLDWVIVEQVLPKTQTRRATMSLRTVAGFILRSLQNDSS